MAPQVRIAAAACLMASGLLVAGTGASLALAAPDSGSAGSSSGPTNDPAATDTSGVPVPGGVTIGPGVAGGGAKPSSPVGDGRNGLPTGATTGSASGTASASSSEALPTSVVAEPPSKPGESESTSTPQTGSTSPSELTSGVTTRVSVDPSVAAATIPSGLAVVPEAVDPNSTEETPPPTTTGAPALGWPCSWWNWYPQTPTGGGGGGVRAPTIEWHSPIPPVMQLPIPQFPTIPRELVPRLPGISFDPLIDAVNGVVTGVNGAVTGLATAASQLPFTQITLPVIVIPGADAAAGAGGGSGPSGAGGPGLAPRPGIPSAPKPPVTTHGDSSMPPPPKSGRQQNSPPAFSAGNQAIPAPSYRMGYVEYLRAAGFGQVAAVAVPGFTGILILTGAGGLIGYRQARAGRSVRSGNTARFMG
ncbi:MAG TPA: hypothetical protein VGO30_26205 [Mycobacterium sp.]|nr:hypothetical protein [Mycobacterium sp.]